MFYHNKWKFTGVPYPPASSYSFILTHNTIVAVMLCLFTKLQAWLLWTRVKLYFEQNDLSKLTDKEKQVIKDFSSLNDAIFKIKNSKAKQKEITSFFFWWTRLKVLFPYITLTYILFVRVLSERWCYVYLLVLCL